MRKHKQRDDCFRIHLENIADPWTSMYSVDLCIQWRVQHLHILTALLPPSQNTTPTILSTYVREANTLHMLILWAWGSTVEGLWVTSVRVEVEIMCDHQSKPMCLITVTDRKCKWSVGMTNCSHTSLHKVVSAWKEMRDTRWDGCLTSRIL